MPKFGTKRTIVLAVLLALTPAIFTSCDKNHKQASAEEIGNLKLLRFERELFDTPQAALQQHLRTIKPQYNSSLLNIFPDDETYIAQVMEVVSSPLPREIYDSVEKHYHNLSPIHTQLAQALSKAHEICPDISYNTLITFTSGMLDYSHRVAVDDHTILLALDQYVVPCFGKYAHFDLPNYLVELSDSVYIVTDCLTEIARHHTAWNDNERTMLDYMIAEGKALYFAKTLVPTTSDELLFRYSKPQLQWAKDNESNVWAYLIAHNMLFESDYNKFHNFVEDAPKTNALGESAPRMTAYIGLHIVERYVKQTKTSLCELLEESDSQKILRLSGWKPKR